MAGPGVQVSETVEPEVRSCEPNEGLGVFLPSCFHQRTAPIECEEPRVSIAFDVVRDA